MRGQIINTFVQSLVEKSGIESEFFGKFEDQIKESFDSLLK